MEIFEKRKRFVKLQEDYSCEHSLYREENCLLPKGTEGLVINEHIINLIPNLTDEKVSEITRRFLETRTRETELLWITGRIIEVQFSMLRHSRYEPPDGYFEDEDDFGNAYEEFIQRVDDEYKKPYGGH